MMARAMGLLAGLLAVTALAMIACAADPPVSVPTQTGTPTTHAAVPQSSGIATSAARPSPTATVQPVPTAAIATTPPSAANTPARPEFTLTPVPQSTGIEPQTTAPDRFLIRLKDDLDDPLGYCIDVRGFGSSIRLDADLQAHSCKTRAADDQAFAILDEPPAGDIVLVDYDVCLAVAQPEPGASIMLSPCDDESVFRRFEWLDDGRVHLLVERDAWSPKLCIGVADGAGEPAGGRSHLRRDLMLRDCAGTDLSLIAWNEAPNR